MPVRITHRASVGRIGGADNVAETSKKERKK